MTAQPTLVLGASGAAVQLLAQQLQASGAMPQGALPEQYTRELENLVKDFQQTHIGEDGSQLESDGVVGPDTWWALANSSGPLQRSGLLTGVPKGLGPLRTAILETALAEHRKNVVEQPSGSNRGPDVDKYLPDWITAKDEKGPPWCCFFYSWTVKQALGDWPLGAREGSCGKARERAGARGLWIPKTMPGAHPIPGDAFVMDHGGGQGHIGFVLRVSADGKDINTLEGNCANRVKLSLRSVAQADLLGFIDNVPSEQPTDFERGIVTTGRANADSTR
jgi:peptidoglycan hydrolase-like protein with peptidoglycan-binding domain